MNKSVNLHISTIVPMKTTSSRPIVNSQDLSTRSIGYTDNTSAGEDDYYISRLQALIQKSTAARKTSGDGEPQDLDNDSRSHQVTVEQKTDRSHSGESMQDVDDVSENVEEEKESTVQKKETNVDEYDENDQELDDVEKCEPGTCINILKVGPRRGERCGKRLLQSTQKHGADRFCKECLNSTKIKHLLEDEAEADCDVQGCP
jgi:hypothetical protein